MTDQVPTSRRRSGDVRVRLVAAGYALLRERGIGATTVKEIAARAGVTPGLFHYYFSSKDDLLLAVVAESGEEMKRRLVLDAAGEPATADRIDAASGFIEDLVAVDPALFRARYELYALALRDPRFLADVGAQLGHIRAAMTATLGAWAEDGAPGRTEALSALVLACFDGLALQRLTQPGADLRPAYALLAAMMKEELCPTTPTP